MTSPEGQATHQAQLTGCEAIVSSRQRSGLAKSCQSTDGKDSKRENGSETSPGHGKERNDNRQWNEARQANPCWNVVVLFWVVEVEDSASMTYTVQRYYYHSYE